MPSSDRLKLKRRSFLPLAAAGAAGCGLSPKPAPGYRVLTPAEVETLEAWCEALVPADRDPGAKDARVARFIDIQLTRKYRKLLPAYRRALASYSAWRSRSAGTGDKALLTRMEKGQAPRDLFADGGKEAFEMVLAHTMQGFYGSPRHGGNRDYVSWKMLGIPLAPVRGREHYAVEEVKS